MTQPINANKAKRLIDQLLDEGYYEATRQIFSIIQQDAQSGLLKYRLDELAAEIKRLQAKGLTLTAQNPVLKTTLADFRSALDRQAQLLDQNAPALERLAIKASEKLSKELTFPDPVDFYKMGASWNVPNPDVVFRAVDYTMQPAWAEHLSKYKSFSAHVVNNIAIRGILTGQDPLQTARDLQRAMSDIPLHQANILMRTLQLNTYREAAVLHRMANEDILTEQIRIAVLDRRTCAACVALHGKHLPLNARIDDHWFGRCTSINVVKGRTRNIQSGEDWFRNQPEKVQRSILGRDALKASQNGDVRLSDFAGAHHDKLFGDQVERRSLKAIFAGEGKVYQVPEMK